MANKRSLNRVILLGNVGKEPEVNHVTSLDRDVAKFSLATTEVYLDKKDNKWKDTTQWHNIVAWGYLAQKVEKKVKSGTMLAIEGKVTYRKWKDKHDQDRWKTEIVADSISVIENGKKNGNGDHENNGDIPPDGIPYDAPPM